MTLNPSCCEGVLSSSVPDPKVNPNMSWKQSKAVPESNGPVLHHDEIGSGEPTMADLCRMLKNNFD